MGLGTTPADIGRLTGALRAITDSGARWRYRYVTEYDEYAPQGAKLDGWGARSGLPARSVGA